LPREYTFAVDEVDADLDAVVTQPTACSRSTPPPNVSQEPRLISDT